MTNIASMQDEATGPPLSRDCGRAWGILLSAGFLRMGSAKFITSFQNHGGQSRCLAPAKTPTRHAGQGGGRRVAVGSAKVRCRYLLLQRPPPAGGDV